MMVLGEPFTLVIPIFQHFVPSLSPKLHMGDKFMSLNEFEDFFSIKSTKS